MELDLEQEMTTDWEGRDLACNDQFFLLISVQK